MGIEPSRDAIDALGVNERRRLYAEEIRAVANLRTPGLVEALASVPREKFLRRGPWKIPFADVDRFGELGYRDTPDADPKHVYHNVLVALDPDRQLNNGHPSSLCQWIDALAISGGARVFHLGCGSGYYTALMAELAGPQGHVLAVEIDPALADLAKRALDDRRTIDVRLGDGMSIDPGPVDAILVNAGVTHTQTLWLDRLLPGARLLMPLTFTAPGATTGSGIMVLIQRIDTQFSARAIGPVGIFAAQNGRVDELNAKLAAVLAKGGWRRLASVRRDAHATDESCWHHVDGACFSTRTLSEIPR